MAINLQKGQSIVLSKSEYNLSKLTMGLGWDVGKTGGLLGGLFGGSNFDLDSYAILLNENDKLQDEREDVVYFGHLKNSTNTVVHSGDNLTGEGSGDDERIVIKLSDLAEKYHKIILVVNIFDAQERKQHFGLVKNAFVRALDATGKEIARYTLSGSSSFDGKITMLMGELSKQNNQWQFKALGEALNSNRTQTVALYRK